MINETKLTRKDINLFLKNNKELLESLHKNLEMEFIAMPIAKFNKGGDLNYRKFIYKSPVRNFRQSSEYYLMVVDNKIAFCRKSNHWGSFWASSSELSEDGFSKSKNYNWNLLGGDVEAKNSQAGYIVLN